MIGCDWLNLMTALKVVMKYNLKALTTNSRDLRTALMF